MSEVLRLLEYERQTWQQLCDKLDAVPPPAASTIRPPHATLSAVSKSSFVLEA
jgi:hypothetical protein